MNRLIALGLYLTLYILGAGAFMAGFVALLDAVAPLPPPEFTPRRRPHPEDVQ